MGIPTITAISPSITDKDITAFENAIKGRLPAPYRRFLLQHNGGYPEPSSSKGIPVSVFWGIKTPKKFYDLRVSNRRMRKWLPKEVITIGIDQIGDEICLAIKGKNRGKLYLWDHEGRPENVDIRAKYPGIIFNDDDSSQPREPITDDWPGEPDLVLIADSFTEFFEGFYEFVLDELDEPKVKRKRPK